MKTVNGLAEVAMIESPEGIAKAESPLGKPFLRVKFENGLVVDMTTNLAEMLGGLGAGLRKRHEDKTGRAN
jgi:hypothetical protein